MPHRTHYPIDVLGSIALAVHAAALPSTVTSLDPLYPLSSTSHLTPPTALPSTCQGDHWPEPLSRKTLATLCLVSKDFREAARPWLWRRLEINIPRHWLEILDAICGEDEQSSTVYGRNLACLPASQSAGAEKKSGTGSNGPFALLKGLGTVPHELLTPISSRAPSPTGLRLRAATPGRWRFIKAMNQIVHNSEPGLYVPTPYDPSPGRHVQHLDFNHFRTLGLRRSVGDGVNGPFVTDVRLERILKEMPNLRAFGANEFMESAISVGVLSELILRGSPIQSNQRLPIRRRRGEKQDRAAWPKELDSDSSGSDADEAERLAAAKPLEALDFCGCVGTAFATALQAFVHNEGLLSSSAHGRMPRRTFGGLQRLGLRGVMSVPSDVLSALVLSFPNLTHLDLTGTICTPDILEGLSAQASNTEFGRGMRLKSLALSRCMRLSSSALARFIIGPTYNVTAVVDGVQGSPPSWSRGGVCDQLEELSLYGDNSYPTPLKEEDLYLIVSSAPCFTSNATKMTYLDLSSCPVTARILNRMFANAGGAGGLRSVGLSHIASLPLAPLITFITSRAPNVEILTLVDSCIDELSMATFSGIGSVGGVSLAVRQKLLDPICSLPSWTRSPNPHIAPRVCEQQDEAPTRLRVLEFSNALLNVLPPGPQPSYFSPISMDASLCSPASSTWTTVRSRGGRAWYVDASACWVNGRFVRGSTSPKPPAEVKSVQEDIAKLSALGAGAAAGHGSVGWHARKMEVLHGLGMLGREDGLYGAVSFTYTSG